VVFLGKTGQRVKFSTPVTLKIEARKRIAIPMLSGGTLQANPHHLGIGSLSSTMFTPQAGIGRGLGVNTFGNIVPHSGPSTSALSGAPGLLSPGMTHTSINPEETFIKRIGRHLFDVVWEVTLTRVGKLIKPKFLSLDHRSTTWGEAE
jgi:hypothetical protein